MEREFPPLPFLLHQMFAVAEEERRLNARCVATGLPPFPPSIVGLRLFYVAPEPFHHPIQPLLLSPEQLGLRLGLDAGLEAIQENVDPPKPKIRRIENREKVEEVQIENKNRAAGSKPHPSLSAGFCRAPSMETARHVNDEKAKKEKLSLSLSHSTCSNRSTDKTPEMLLRLFPDPPWIQRQKSRTSAMARRRRLKVSERMGKLAELMPWDRRVDTSTLLEEARRYVVFLQAQVAALTWMPVDGATDRFDAMRAAVTSRRMQEWMYKRELCVWTVEQMHHMRRAPRLSSPPPPKVQQIQQL